MNYMLTARSGFTSGASWRIGDRPIVIGRAPDCDIVVQDGTVSRRQCQLRQRDASLLLEDLGGQNPVLVNGRPVVESRLNAGDLIAVGSALFQVGTFETKSPTPAVEISEPETMSLRHAQLPFFRQQGVSSSDLPHVMRDYVTLFQFCRTLSLCQRVDTLVARARAVIEEQFRPTSVSFLRRRGDAWEALDNLSVVPDSPTVHLLMEQAETEGRTMLAPLGKGEVCYIVAPLRAFQMPLGMIILVFEDEDLLTLEQKMVLSAALAEVLGPFLDSMTRCERLSRLNARFTQLAHSDNQLVGQSAAMLRLQEGIRGAGRSDEHVMLLGETGTGKELAARAIHDASRRSKFPYVVVNCAAIPQELFESEIFGHARGAFTGAQSAKVGLMEEANGGTLFLDEVGDLSAANQARILRAIEHGTFRRVGETEERHADVRVISATNLNLPSPGFREDLYHRLAGVVLDLPPLRNRLSDIPLLARHFLDELAANDDTIYRELDESANNYLQQRAWTGNVRELRNFVIRAAHFTRQETIMASDLAACERAYGRAAASAKMPTLADMERDHIRRVLREVGGNVSKASKILGISRSTLYTRMNDLDSPAP